MYIKDTELFADSPGWTYIDQHIPATNLLAAINLLHIKMHLSPATLLFALPTLSSALVPRWHQSGSFEVDVSKVISTTNIPTKSVP